MLLVTVGGRHRQVSGSVNAAGTNAEQQNDRAVHTPRQVGRNGPSVMHHPKVAAL